MDWGSFNYLLSDYKAMRDMIYNDVPSFDTIIASIEKLEKEINALK